MICVFSCHAFADIPELHCAKMWDHAFYTLMEKWRDVSTEESLGLILVFNDLILSILSAY